MIVSHEHHYIFFKTAKTAGTSIEIALSQFCGNKDIITPISSEDEELRKQLGYRDPQNYELPLSQYTLRDWARLIVRWRQPPQLFNHIPASYLQARISPRIWKSYFKFCVERNPWDKVLSRYFWCTRNQNPRPSLHDFLKVVDPASLSDFDIYSMDGSIVVDRVCRYENLTEEMKEIARRLNLPGTLVIPRAKGSYRTDNRHYREMMSEGDRELIERECSREIALLGYEF